ncbi:MAG: GC-type dockerin domain-anchored protein [Planctomycetota bacterium]
MNKQMIRGAAACAMVAGLALSSADAQIFQREVGNENPEWAYSVDTTSDGGSVTAGYRRVPDRSFEFHIVKYKPDGETEWEVTFGGDREDIAYSVQETSDGGYIVAGESRSFEAGFEIVLLRLDSAGNQLWANSYPGSSMVDPIHTPHPGVALDQGDEDEIYVVGRLANTAGESRPIAFRTDAGGGLQWHASYVAPPTTGDIADLAFTDVAYSFVDRSIVISGTIRDEGPIFPDDPTGFFTTRQDATLLKVNADPDSAAGVPGGLPRWFNRYDSLFDRDSPNEPNVWETGDGLDIFNQGQIILAGRTDLGIGGPGGSLRATHLVHTDMMGMPFWSRDYEAFTADGVAASVETAYAAIEFDRRVDAFVQAGRVVAGGPTSEHTQLTAIGGAPIWAWQYGDNEFRSFGESVQPDLEGCGYVYGGALFNPTPPPGQGASDISIVKNNDAGETGCLEQELFTEPVAPLQPRPLQVFANFQDGQIELPDLTEPMESPNTVFCLSDDCDVAPDPCNEADLVPPFGVIDLDDINAFILAYTLMLPPADIAPPFGVWDLSDINAFITAFLDGCP